MSGLRRTVELDTTDPSLVRAWDDLAGAEDFYLSATLNLAAERMRPQQTAHLAVIDDQDSLLAVLPTFVIDSSASSPFIRPDLALARLGRNADVDALNQILPALHCGSRQVGRSSPLIAPELGVDLVNSILHTIVDGALRVADQSTANSVSMLYVEEHSHLLRSTLRDCGFAEFHSGWNCLLVTPWDDFEGYLRSRSASRRTQVRRERAKLAAAGISFTTSPLEPADAERLAVLEAKVHARHGNPQDVAKLAMMLAGMAEGMAGRTFLVSAWRGRVLLGFALFLRWRDWIYLANVGMDHESSAGLPLYFGLAFYEPVTYAVTHGVSAIDYGQGSWQSKQSRGCRLISQFGYLRCLDPVLQRLIDDLTSSLREAGTRAQHQ